MYNVLRNGAKTAAQPTLKYSAMAALSRELSKEVEEFLPLRKTVRASCKSIVYVWDEKELCRHMNII